MRGGSSVTADRTVPAPEWRAYVFYEMRAMMRCPVVAHIGARRAPDAFSVPQAEAGSEAWYGDVDEAEDSHQDNEDW